MSRNYPARLKRLEQRVEGLQPTEYRSAPEPPPAVPNAGIGVAPDSSPWDDSPLVRCSSLGLPHVGRWIEWIPGRYTLQDNASLFAVVGVLVGIRPDNDQDAGRHGRGRVLVLRQGLEQTAFRIPAIDEIQVGSPA